ncbi:MAG: MG2 domain-containing protein [Cystobacterineae bacterium]|nr:MG2 domain-containing protein [Cystobacterineae bacterium]
MRVGRLLSVAMVVVLGMWGCKGCLKEKPETPGEETQAAVSEKIRIEELQPLPLPPVLEGAPVFAPTGALEVVASRAQNGENPFGPTLVFSAPVQVLEGEPIVVNGRPFASIEPQLEGEWRWLGSTTVEFVPLKPPPLSTEYTVRVQAGLRALSGAELKEEYVFVAQNERIKLLALSPRAGDQRLQRSPRIELVFNQAVDEKQLLEQAVLKQRGVHAPMALRLEEKFTTRERLEKQREEAKARGESTSYYEQMLDESHAAFLRQTSYVLMPVRPLELEQEVEFWLPPIKSAEGPLQTEEGVERRWRTHGPLEVKKIEMSDGTGALRILSNNCLSAKSLKTKFKTVPPVEISAHYCSTYEGIQELVYASFAPGTSYEIRLEKGLKDEFGQELEADFVAHIKTADVEPYLGLGGSNTLVELSQVEKGLPLSFRNLEQAELRAWRVNVEEFMRLHTEGYKLIQGESPPSVISQFLGRGPDIQKSLKLKAARNVQASLKLDVKELLAKPEEGGFVFIYVEEPGNSSKHKSHTLLQVADFIVHAKIGNASSAAWVTRLQDAQGMEDVHVQLFGDNQKLLWKGTTDKQGLVSMLGLQAEGVSKNQYAGNLFVVATKGEKVTLTSTRWDMFSAWQFGLEGGWPSQQPEAQGILFTDRGVYRPGDEIHLKGILRYVELGEKKIPEGARIGVSAHCGGDETYTWKTEVQLSAFGTFSISEHIPKDVPLGTCWVVASDGQQLSVQGSFQVEEYRAPKFALTLKPEKKELLMQEPLNVQVDARYYFGSPMSEAPLKWNVFSRPKPLRFEQHPLYVFGGQSNGYGEDDEEHGAGELSRVASGSGKTGKGGDYAIALRSVDAPKESAYTYTVEAAATDVDRQMAGGSTRLSIFPSAYVVGLKAPSTYPQVNKSAEVSVLVTDITGKPLAGKPVEVVLNRIEWKLIEQKDATGGFRTISERQETEFKHCRLSSAVSGSACEFVASEPGYYVAKAEVKDEQGRVHRTQNSFYVLGEGFISWNRDEEQTLELVVDKQSYGVGDTAHILVKSPYPEATALVMVEGDGIMSKQVVQLQSSLHKLEIPITEEMIPNAFVSVLVMRPRMMKGGIEPGRDAGRPAVRMGLVGFKVEKKEKRLMVSTQTDKSTYGPQEEVTVDVAVADFKGKAVDAEVTLYVVDEAVLALTAYKTPDVIESFYGERRLSTRLAEPLMHLLYMRGQEEKGEDEGGGGGEELKRVMGIRSDFKTTVYFNPSLLMHNGTAQVKFKLPDNMTKFRVMAVAVSKDNRFGKGEAHFQVNKPLLAQPALPRFLRIDDEFEAGIVLHVTEPGMSKAEATVTAQIQGPVQLRGESSKKVVIVPGKPQEIRFPFLALGEGDAKFIFQVNMGSLSDGVEQELYVEKAGIPQAYALYGEVDGAASKELLKKVEGVKLPEGVLESFGGLELQLSSTSMGNLEEGFKQLVQYPYGCAEQRASKLIPFIALREIAGLFSLPWPDKADAASELSAVWNRWRADEPSLRKNAHPDVVIQKNVDELLSMQALDGGFRYWSSSACSSPWVSSFVTLALWRAREVAFAVPSEKLLQAQKYVEAVLGGRASDCGYWKANMETRVMAAYVLARMHQPKPSYYPELLKQQDKLTTFSKALLAHAMWIGKGDKLQAEKLLKELLSKARETAKTVYIEDSLDVGALFGSPVRTTGAVLQTLALVSPQHPYITKMVRYLAEDSRRRDGSWSSTQEAAFALMGLVDVLRQKEREEPDFVARTLLGDNPVVEKVFKGRSLKAENAQIPMETLLQSGTVGESKNLAFEKEGVGVLYYSALLKYMSKQLPQTPMERGIAVQRWFEPEDKKLQTKKSWAGDRVRVVVRIATHEPRHFVAIEVPLPAGLEAINASLATSVGSFEPTEANANRLVWASPFNHVETRDSKVVLFADELSPGTYEYRFWARATTIGKFVLKPAMASLMYQPDVWGSTAASVFEVLP